MVLTLWLMIRCVIILALRAAVDCHLAAANSFKQHLVLLATLTFADGIGVVVVGEDVVWLLEDQRLGAFERIF